MPLIPWLVQLVRWAFSSWWAMFVLFIVTSAGGLLIRLMGAAGVGFVTYQVGSWGLDQMFSLVKGYLTSLPPEIIAFAALARFDEALALVFSAIAAKMALKGFTSSASTGKVRQAFWRA